MMADHTRPVTGGVDTHKDLHVAAVVDANGTVLGTEAFANDSTGHRQLGDWVASHGRVGSVGVEGTGSYGAGLRRHLGSAGIDVVEVNRPDRSERRRTGKSDPIDAVAAARAVLSGRHAGTAKAGDATVESIRMLRLCRRSAVRSRTQTANQIHALVDTAPAPLHDAWASKTLTELVDTDPSGSSPSTVPAQTAAYSLGLLGARWQALTAEIAELDGHLDQLVSTAAPSLVACYGFGTDTVGALLVAVGDNPHRLRSHALPQALHRPRGLPLPSTPRLSSAGWADPHGGRPGATRCLRCDLSPTRHPTCQAVAS
jgi:transposase